MYTLTCWPFSPSKCLNECVRIFMTIFECIFEFMYGCVFVCMYVCMYVCVYDCVHVCMYVCLYVFTYSCKSVVDICCKSNPSVPVFQCDQQTIGPSFIWTCLTTIVTKRMKQVDQCQVTLNSLATGNVLINYDFLKSFVCKSI